MTRKPLISALFVFGLLVVALTLLPVFARPSAAQCVPPECIPPEPTYGSPQQPNTGGSWSGFSDGRLNPDMAEYYSVWCRSDLIEVWGGMPAPQLLAAIPIVDVLALGEIGSFDAGSGLTVSKTGDVVTISGANGNGTAPGSKWFSLSACLTANGRTPEVPPPQAPPQPIQNLPEGQVDDPPAGADAAIGDVWLCLPGTTSMADFLRCLNFFAPDDQTNDYRYIIAWAVATFCASGFAPFGLVAAIPAVHLWRRRRK